MLDERARAAGGGARVAGAGAPRRDPAAQVRGAVVRRDRTRLGKSEDACRMLLRPRDDGAHARRSAGSVAMSALGRDLEAAARPLRRAPRAPRRALDLASVVRRPSRPRAEPLARSGPPVSRSDRLARPGSAGRRRAPARARATAALRRLPDDRAHRRRRHGRGLQAPGPAAGPHRRRQGRPRATPPRAASGIDGFLREARALALFSDRRIVQVFEVRPDATRPVIIMEFVDGFELGRIGPSLEFAQRARILVEICEAVHHAHTLGLQHRDLKPSNIMLDAQLAPRILDFGLSAGDPARGHLQGHAALHRARAAGSRRSRSTRAPTSTRSASMLYELLCGGRRTPRDDERVIARSGRAAAAAGRDRSARARAAAGDRAHGDGARPGRRVPVRARDGGRPAALPRRPAGARPADDLRHDARHRASRRTSSRSASGCGCG